MRYASHSWGKLGRVGGPPLIVEQVQSELSGLYVVAFAGGRPVSKEVAGQAPMAARAHHIFVYTY